MFRAGTRALLGRVRNFTNEASASGGSKATPPSAVGLSTSVVRPPEQTEGPGVPGDKSGDYKVPEYFCYNTMSYYEAEIEMAKYRLPQPSSHK